MDFFLALVEVGSYLVYYSSHVVFRLIRINHKRTFKLVLLSLSEDSMLRFIQKYY